MVDHIRMRIDGRIAEPPRGATGNATTGNQQRFNVVQVVDNKSAKEVKYKMGNQIQTTKELSTRAKEVLQKNAELRRRDSNFVKMQAGEKRTFQFDPEKIEQVEAEFSGKKSIRFRYRVVEEGADKEQYFELLETQVLRTN